MQGDYNVHLMWWFERRGYQAPCYPPKCIENYTQIFLGNKDRWQIDKTHLYECEIVHGSRKAHQVQFVSPKICM